MTGINTCNNGQVSVITKGGDQENYDIVITTIPVPQLLKLSGSVFEGNLITLHVKFTTVLNSIL